MENLKNKINILFFASCLGGGGAEKHLMFIMNALDREKFGISLAVSRVGGSYETLLANDIKIYHLNRWKLKSSTINLIASTIPLRRIVKSIKPCIVCSILTPANVFAILTTRFLKTSPRLVLLVQYPPSIDFIHTNNIMSKLLLLLARSLYTKADKVVVLSKGVKSDLLNFIPKLDRNKVSVIYNAAMEQGMLNLAKEKLLPLIASKNVPMLIACGRLTKQKGFAYLLKALVYVRKTIPANLCILGEGKLLGYLKKKVNILGLDNCVQFLGFQQNPYKYMSKADVFVLSSLYEGLGNVIVEAMACGVPVVATDCPYGPAEIITNGVNGILVPPKDPATLAEAIIQVLKDKELVNKLVQNGRVRALDFEAKKIAAEHEKIFLETVVSRSLT